MKLKKVSVDVRSCRWHNLRKEYSGKYGVDFVWYIEDELERKVRNEVVWLSFFYQMRKMNEL